MTEHKKQHRKNRTLVFALVFIVMSLILSVTLMFMLMTEMASSARQESDAHLLEIATQTSYNIRYQLEENWRIIESLEQNLALYLSVDKQNLYQQLQKLCQRWNYSHIYMIDAQGSYRDENGEAGRISYSSSIDKLLSGRQPIMTLRSDEAGRDMLLFAMPVEAVEIDGLNVSNLGVAYELDTVLDAMQIEAFGGSSICYVVDKEGNQLFRSLGENAIEAEKFFGYLKKYWFLSGTLSGISDDIALGRQGTVRVDMDGTETVFGYVPLGDTEWTLVMSVPAEVLGAYMNDFSAKAVALSLTMVCLVVLMSVSAFIALNVRADRSRDAEIRTRERLFNLLTERARDVFLLRTADADPNDFEYVSTNTDRVLGVSRAEISHDFIYRNIPAQEDHQQMLRGEFDAWDGQTDFISSMFPYCHPRTGQTLWLRAQVYPSRSADNTYQVIALSDATYEYSQQQSLQQALLSAQTANAAKSRFLSNMSHDIRTPINGIVGMTAIAERNAENPERVRDCLNKISISSRHLIGLINDVLDMSKIESGKLALSFSKFTLPDVVDGLSTMIGSQARSRGLVLEMRVDQIRHEKLIGDSVRLNQVLTNLLSNAVKFTPEGGSVLLEIRELPQQRDGYANFRFIVADTGRGMSPEFLKVLFDPFTRSQDSVANRIEGTGLGMSIAKSVIELMGGHIQVTSTEGAGTTFTVELSLETQEKETVAVDASRLASLRVLVVDEEIEVGQSIVETLGAAGMNACWSASVRDAALLVQEARETENSFAVVLFEPENDSGAIDGIRALRGAAGANAVVFALSTTDECVSQQQAREAGADALLSKPFFLSAFVQALGNRIAQPVIEPLRDADVYQGRHFLVAEDNDLNAEIISEILQVAGAEVVLAENGKIAVDRFENAPAGSFDVILMDIQMPIMNGYEAARAIRKSKHPDAQRVPILALTADAFAENIAMALDAGMDAHAAKPIDTEALRATLYHIFQNGREKAES